MNFSSIFINLGNYFSLTMVPHFLSGLVPVEASRGSLLIQEMSLTKFATLALFAALVVRTAMMKSPRTPLLLSFTAGAVGYVTLVSLIHFQFIPWTTSAIYGSVFPVFFSVMLALIFAELAAEPGPQHRITASLLILAVCATQICNFQPASEAMRQTQLRLTYERYGEKHDPVQFDLRHPSEISRAELQALRAAWRTGTLDDYLRKNGLSTAAVYFLWELRFAGAPI
jgi:hypothetical protein